VTIGEVSQRAAPAISKHAEAGAVIANRYRILDRIGEGGMGAVYKVLDLALDRVVAMKTIHPQMAENTRALQRSPARHRALPPPRFRPPGLRDHFRRSKELYKTLHGKNFSRAVAGL
jgi:serine/threonine protein kinase